MNPPKHNGQWKFPVEASRARQHYYADQGPALIDADDPTEDLANEITSELPPPGTWSGMAQPRAIEADADAAGLETTGNATIVTSGTVLRDRFVLEQQIGSGGTAVISRARDLQRDGETDDGSHVAIKLLRPEFRDQPQSIARLLREFRQTRSLAHPNIVRFYDLDCDRGTWFIAMELLNGEALGQRLRRASPQGLPAREALRIAVACGEALAFAHEHGVTHGDVKPDNVFVTATGEVRVLDFGVAPEPVLEPPPLDSTMVDRVAAAATRAYASPEVLAGQRPEPRDDVFSLACVIYEMLAGRHPYGRRGASEARDARLKIKPLPGLSTRQWRPLAAGLAWRRERRPAGVREFLQALGSDAPAHPPMQEAVALPVRIVAGELQRPSSRVWRGAAAIVVVAALGVLIGRFWLQSPSEPQPLSRATPVIAAVKASDASNGGIANGVGASAVADRKTPIVPNTAPTVSTRTQSSMPPVQVSFDAASMVVSQRAVTAAIPVRRLDHAGGSVRFAWRVLDGTAVAGQDYGGPPGGVAGFAEGHTYRMIYVPIVNDAQTIGDRTFTVELTGASHGASLESGSRIIVTIRDDDYRARGGLPLAAPVPLLPSLRPRT